MKEHSGQERIQFLKGILVMFQPIDDLAHVVPLGSCNMSIAAIHYQIAQEEPLLRKLYGWVT